MRHKRILLTENHVEEAMACHVLIGSDSTRNGKNKRFTYQPLTKEYFVYIDGSIFSHGTIVETLLNEYNDA